MRKFVIITLLACLAVMLMSSTIYAQIEVDVDNTVDVGDPVNVVDGYLQIGSADKSRGLSLNSSFDNVSATNRYGIYNNVEAITSTGTYHGILNNVPTISNTPVFKHGILNQLTGAVGSAAFGYHNIIDNYQSTAYGMRNFIKGTGTHSYGMSNVMESTDIGSKYGVRTNIKPTASSQYAFGVYNELQSHMTLWKKGIVNILNGTARLAVGTDNFITTAAALDIFGTKSDLVQNSNGQIFGSLSVINATVQMTTRDVFGSYNSIQSFNGRPTYGTYNDVVVNVDVGHKYGSYNVIRKGADEMTVTGGTAIGVYSDIEGQEGFAGYFMGEIMTNMPVNTSSDKRLKENIKDLKDNLNKVKQLKPKKYDYKDKQKKESSKNKFGFLAQDVAEVFPELVSLVPMPGEAKRVEISPEEVIELEDGSTITREAKYTMRRDLDGEPRYALEYNGFIPILTGAIQEQQAEIDDLKKNNSKSFQNNTNRIFELEEQLIQTREALATTNKKYDQLVHHIETLLKCVDCDGLRRSGDRGQIQFEDKFRLYPNPAKGSITIEALQKTSRSYQIAITDNAGRKVLDNYNLTDDLTPVDVSSLSSGLYNVSIIENGEVVATESLIIVNR